MPQICPYITSIVIGLLLFYSSGKSFAQAESHIRKKMEITDGIAPKSVVSSCDGIVAAQNMMYRHSVTLYNSDGERLAKIKDEVRLTDFGIKDYGSGKYQGAPVEGVFTADGRYLWVSNYLLTGENLENPGCDNCRGKGFDPGFVYKINLENYSIDNVIAVGSVPKFISISPDQKKLIVSNWVSSDISIIDLETEEEVKRIDVGSHPRGIAITQDNKYAFVTIMGADKIARTDLQTYSVEYITNPGKSPRTVLLADHDSTLYVSLNGSGEILKYNRFSKETFRCKTPGGPRSMILSPDEQWLYVVNYFDDHFTKIATDSMLIEAEIETAAKPIGITANWEKGEVWVACYSGKIEIFKDFSLKSTSTSSFLGIPLPQLNLTAYKGSDLPRQSDTLSPATTEKEMLRSAIMPKMSAQNKPKEKELTIAPNTTNTPCSHHIIVGAFSNPSNAEKRRDDLADKGYASIIIPGQKLNYVSAACYTRRDMAEKARQKMAIELTEFGTPWILKK